MAVFAPVFHSLEHALSNHETHQHHHGEHHDQQHSDTALQAMQDCQLCQHLEQLSSWTLEPSIVSQGIDSHLHTTTKYNLLDIAQDSLRLAPKNSPPQA